MIKYIDAFQSYYFIRDNEPMVVRLAFTPSAIIYNFWYQALSIRLKLKDDTVSYEMKLSIKLLMPLKFGQIVRLALD